MTWLKKTVEHQRQGLSQFLQRPLYVMAQNAAIVWDDLDLLDRELNQSLSQIPLCQVLYAVNTEGIQVSSNISTLSIDVEKRGQNLSMRPFLANAVPRTGMLLSDVYISQLGGGACITAVQPVSKNGTMLGFVAADFYLRDLPLLEEPAVKQSSWRQMKGDPAIRGTLFMQERVKSAMDEQMDDVIAIMDELICERGVFHGKLHFSSSRATLWLTDDPYRYRLHVLDEIIDPAVCLAYPNQEYSPQATVSPELVKPVFERFKLLRDADENIYLRSGSLNVINGMVGLTFSCDGSHYMPAEKFLEKDEAFWFGTVGMPGAVLPE